MVEAKDAVPVSDRLKSKDFERRGGARERAEFSHWRKPEGGNEAERTLRRRGQAIKSARGMPWHQEPTKDVTSCDKPRGGANIH